MLVKVFEAFDRLPDLRVLADFRLQFLKKLLNDSGSAVRGRIVVVDDLIAGHDVAIRPCTPLVYAGRHRWYPDLAAGFTYAAPTSYFHQLYRHRLEIGSGQLPILRGWHDFSSAEM